MNLIKYLEGKKTYIMALLTLLYGVYHAWQQSNNNWPVFVNYLLASGTIAALRAAIAKL